MKWLFPKSERDMLQFLLGLASMNFIYVVQPSWSEGRRLIEAGLWWNVFAFMGTIALLMWFVFAFYIYRRDKKKESGK